MSLTVAVALDVLSQVEPPLPDPAFTCELLVCHLHLDRAQHALNAIKRGDKHAVVASKAIDDVMSALTDACRSASALADACIDGERITRIRTQCESIRTELDAVVRAAARGDAHRFELQLAGLSSADVPALAIPALPAAAADATTGAAPDAAAVQAMAATNLSWVPHLPAGTTLQAAAAWLRNKQLAGLPVALAEQVRRAHVQQAVFGAIQRLPTTTMEDTAAMLDGEQLASLRKLVGFNALGQSAAVIATWGTYCLHHQAAKHAYPQLQRYNAAPRFQDLRHLKCPDKATEDALRAVCAYLARHQHHAQTAFSGRDGELSHTNALADEVAAVDADIMARWTAAQRDAPRRAAARFAAIRAQQAQCQDLHRQISAQQQRIDAVNADSLASHHASHCMATDFRGDYCRSCNCHIERRTRLQPLESELSSLKRQLADAQKPPPPLLQPLPRDDVLGRRALFYLHMPAQLEQVCWWSFECYHALAQWKHAVFANASTVGHLDLHAHYEDHQTGRWLTVTKQDASAAHTLAVAFSKPPKYIGSSNVETITDGYDGVWHPADTERWLTLVATSNSAAAAGLLEKLAGYYTTQLAGRAASLQWTMLQYGSNDPVRGNAGIARQSERTTTGLSKPQFLSFCSVRAFPLQQLRKLACALRDESLPLTEPVVHALIRQVLHHVGELGPLPGVEAAERVRPADIRMMWKHDLQEGDMPLVPVLRAELVRLADRYADSHKQHAAVRILGEIAAFMAGYNGEFIPVARAYRDIALRWVGELQPQVAAAQHACDIAGAAALRWKQHVFASYAITSTGVGWALEPDDATRLLLARVWMHAAQPLLGDSPLSQPADLQPATVAADAIMCNRALDVTTAVLREPECITAAVRIVVESLPEGLEWVRPTLPAGSDTQHACVQCTAPTTGLVSVNVTTGMVLVQGQPPNNLPDTIVNHPLYARTFGKRNCAVVLDASGCYRTTGALAGRYYSFHLSGSTLNVVEEQTMSAHTSAAGAATATADTSTGAAPGTPLVRFRLLPHGGAWAAKLPVRLRDLHSHWITTDLGSTPVILFRGIHFADRRTNFLVLPGESITPASGGAALAAAGIYRVPPEAAHLDAAAQLPLLLSWPRMLNNEAHPGLGGVLKVLSKFEARQFIECYSVRDQPPAAPGAAGAASAGAAAASKADSTSAAANGGEATAGARTTSLHIALPRYHIEFALQPGTTIGSADAATNALVSLSHRGYRLAGHQQLNDTLPGFHRYLVLAAVDAKRALLTGQAECKLLVPAHGDVIHAADNAVDVTVSSQCHVQLHCHAYDAHHRWGTLIAGTIDARLQLAALYTACGSRLPDERARMTGDEMAMQLVRQCWGNRPLTPHEDSALRNITAVSSDSVSPGLALVCDDLLRSSLQLSFLYDPAAAAPGSAEALQVATRALGLGDSTASTEYNLLHAAKSVNIRTRLMPDEQLRVLGRRMTTARNMWPPPFHRSLVGWRHIGPVGSVDDIRVQPVQPEPLPMLPLEVVETSLHSMLHVTEGAAASGGTGADVPFPLVGHAALATQIGEHMMAELQQSWRAFQERSQQTLALTPAVCEPMVKTLLSKVTTDRAAVEAYITTSIEALPAQTTTSAASAGAASATDATGAAGTVSSWHAEAVALLRCANDTPLLSRADIARFAFQPDGMLRWNPFLSPDAVSSLQRTVLHWLASCVMEDRMHRIVALCSTGADVGVLARELSLQRDWAPSEHPQWLVFEVENRLQIRPEQCRVITDLLAGNGVISQLNMGLGKTRVILPCLLLHLAPGHPDGICGTDAPLLRVHYLTQLLDEAYDYMHNALCASVLGRKLFRLPFHRDVDVSPARVKLMRDAMRHCQMVAGAVVVAPEHRLSLFLKQQELQLQRAAGDASADATWTALSQLAPLPYHDVFDESDEVLRYKRQLVYAVGRQTALPGGPQRWPVTQAVLHVVRHSALVQAVLSRPVDDAMRAELNMASPEGSPSSTASAATAATVASALATAVTSPVDVGRDGKVATWDVDAPGHAFNHLQLLPSSELERRHRALALAVFHGIMTLMPEPFAWLRDLPLHLLAAVRLAATDPNMPVEGSLEARLFVSEAHFEQVLALRGLLAHGMLAHCLQKRHRVHYGVARDGRPGCKRLAVPFTAADTPSLRSEFAHPDAALVFTMIAYYEDGITREQLVQALRVLLSKGPVAQEATYAQWFNACRPSMADAAAAASIDRAAKIDLTNQGQVDTLHATFSHCMHAIDFWLSNVVLPTETAVYPQRLLATPWHLADGSKWRCGFSGTKDASLLLPLDVKQHESSDADLRATDGRMLHNLMHKATFTPLATPAAGSTAAGGATASVDNAGDASVLDALLHYATTSGARALIDVGALTAGCSTKQVAAALAARLPPDAFRGVVFFDATASSWTVQELNQGHGVKGRQWRLDASPIPAADAFVFFDESRCRGADIKMRGDAMAVLTLAPKLCKDALMQAAGRMRALEYGQTLRVVATPEVEAVVREAVGLAHDDGLTMRHVLEYATANSIAAVGAGLVQWAWHGTHFSTTQDAPSAAVLPETVVLHEMYSKKQSTQAASDVAAATQARMLEARQRALATAAPAATSCPPLSAAVTAKLEGIRAVTDTLGRDVTCHASAQDEECERELEKEQEEEEEQEREVEKATPRAEVDWDAGAALTATSCLQLSRTVTTQPLQSFVRAHVAAASCMAWNAHVFGTSNFFLPLADQHATTTSAATSLADYLRPVDAALVFHSGDVVMISEREADAFLQHVWYRASPAAVPARAPRLVHLPFAKLAADAAGSDTLLPVPAAGPAVAIPPAALTHMQVFAGDTMFASSLHTHVDALVPSKLAAAAAASLPYARGTAHLLDRSNLEEICARVNIRLHAAEDFGGASASTGVTPPSASTAAGAAGAASASASTA